MHSVLTIDLAWRDAPFKTLFAGEGLGAQDRASTVILLADLPRLSNALVYLCVQVLPSTTAIVVSDPTSELVVHCLDPTESMSVRIAANDTE